MILRHAIATFLLCLSVGLNAQTGTVSWSDLRQIASLDWTEQEDAILKMGFAPTAIGTGKTNSGCDSKRYLSDRTIQNGQKNQFGRILCPRDITTLFVTVDKNVHLGIKESALNEGFEYVREEVLNRTIYGKGSEEMHVSWFEVNGTIFYSIDYMKKL